MAESPWGVGVCLRTPLGSHWPARNISELDKQNETGNLKMIKNQFKLNDV